MKHADPLRASIFPFCFTSLKGTTGCVPEEFKYSDQLWFQAQLEQIPKAGQTAEELYFVWVLWECLQNYQSNEQ